MGNADRGNEKLFPLDSQYRCGISYLISPAVGLGVLVLGRCFTCSLVIVYLALQGGSYNCPEPLDSLNLSTS